jgi:pimeloyl-ACP methyl ester carboxylesterase
MSDFLSKGIKGSVVKVIKDAGHSSIIEKPRELSEVIMEFLKKHNM